MLTKRQREALLFIQGEIRRGENVEAAQRELSGFGWVWDVSTGSRRIKRREP